MSDLKPDEAMDEIIGRIHPTVVRAIEQRAAQHVPVVAERRDGTWGVFCWACSYTAEDYVNPCRLGQRARWPEPVLSAVSSS